MIQSRRALMLINPKARRGNLVLDEVFDSLAGAGITFVNSPGEKLDDPADFIRRNADRADIVIAGGGDGTMNAIADVLVETQLVLGVLPLGTANDLARTLGIPPDLRAAGDVIVDGHEQSIDVGCVNGKHFFNVASMGVSVHLARRLTGQNKRRWGVLSYAMALYEAIRATKSFNAVIRCQKQETRLKSIQLAIGNGRFYGGGMTVAEDAAIDDGRLDLYSIQPGPNWRLAMLLPGLRAGWRRRSELVHCLSGGEIEVETDRPMYINTDGEITARTPARFSIKPGAVRVFVPRERAPGLKGGQHCAGAAAA